MAIAWITYAWSDNRSGDIDFISQELINSGLSIKLDRWNIKAGNRLWEQIAQFIQSPNECDAWIFYITQNSLGSEPCKEEFAYALDRALQGRGINFPVIGLFPGSIDNNLIPAAIKTRLYVSLTDPDWKERIIASAEGRDLSVNRPAVEPYEITVHNSLPDSNRKFAIEVRPRAGAWTPFFAAIQNKEQSIVNPSILRGPAGQIPRGGVLHMTGNCVSEDGNWWMLFARDEATPTQSYYILCDILPCELVFGVHNGQPQYLVKI